jgi:hypothetical protein
MPLSRAYGCLEERVAVLYFVLNPYEKHVLTQEKRPPHRERCLAAVTPVESNQR